MVSNSEIFFKASSYLYTLLACVIAYLIWLFFSRNRSTKVETCAKEKAENCTSLSCIRCSKSVFSPEKLLEKWNEIEKALMPDQKTTKRIKNGFLNTSKQKRLKDNERSLQEPTLFHYEGLPGEIWYTSEDFSSEVSILEKQSTMDIFVEEFMNVYEDLDVGWVSNKVPSGGWYLFYFINQGVKNEENCLKCPKVVKVIEGLMSAMLDCAFGNVMFSMLLPGTRIARHCGPTNVRIRCHVPIQAPKGYYISVAGEKRSWQCGEILIFDDSFYHKVYCHGNNSEPRVVLMIDLWHPSLSFREREIIKKLFSPQ